MTDPEIIIYTDGSSRGNPGPGGYGIIMKDCKSGYSKEYSKGFKLTTNNRMELMAVIMALKSIATQEQIKQASNINMQKFEAEITNQQDESTLFAAKNCPNFTKHLNTYLARIAKEKD